METFNRNLEKFTFFVNTFSHFTMFCKKKIENLEFVHGVIFEISDSLRNNGTNYLLIFDDSFEEYFNSKPFVDIACTGRLRGLRTIYLKHNLFHQSKHGRHLKLRNPHNVLFKTPSDVVQSSRLSAQLGRATSVPTLIY